MVDFKVIETFLWVVTSGSFRGAAQRLNTTQPAISQRIAQFEREVGVKLLNRDHRVASPTPSGRQLMVYAEKLIGLRSEMMAAVGPSTSARIPGYDRRRTGRRPRQPNRAAERLG
jgi:DNA-binding transcriptional LysR family regulator